MTRVKRNSFGRDQIRLRRRGNPCGCPFRGIRIWPDKTCPYVNNQPILVTPNSFNVPARLGLAMATMQDSRVILDSNGAEELTPPGQAILVRGMETLTVMTPYLPDDERALRLAALRMGEMELTDLERRVLEAAKSMIEEGKKLTLRGIYDQVGGKYSTVNAAYRRLRDLGQLGSGTQENGSGTVTTQPLPPD